MSVVFIIGTVFLAAIIFLAYVFLGRKKKAGIPPGKNSGVDNKSIADVVKSILRSLAFVTHGKITHDMIVAWFKARKSIIDVDDNKAFTLLMEESDNGIVLVQGIYSTRNEKILDGVKYMAKELDETLKNHHRDNTLVIYS